MRLTLRCACQQEYVYHDCDTSEMGASRFAARDVHRIGILDIRIWNTDRHAGNILVRRPRDSSANLSGVARLDSGQLELVPIDHGFCLPESYESPYFEWLFWPQVWSPPPTVVPSPMRCTIICAMIGQQLRRVRYMKVKEAIDGAAGQMDN